MAFLFEAQQLYIFLSEGLLNDSIQQSELNNLQTSLIKVHFKFWDK